MNTEDYITGLGEYLRDLIPTGKLNLGEKNTIDYDKLLIEIYEFAKTTIRKDGEESGDRATAFEIACNKTIEKIKNENHY